MLLVNREVAGAIAMRDEPRDDAIEGIAALKRIGADVVMLTGDNKRTAAAIAAKLGLEPRAELLPEDKQKIVGELRQQGKFVAKVGDGINDAPALAAADVGIAMGGGTDVALETADAAVLHGRVLDIANMIVLSRATMSKILQNITISLGLKAFVLVTTVIGAIQFADEYGFHGSANENACAAGTEVMQDFCTGTPWPHAIAGFTTAALYFTTAGLSLAMPSPLPRSADVELHATLRWIHLAGMLAVATLGIITANVDADFPTRQALAITHQGLAVATFGVLTAAAVYSDRMPYEVAVRSLVALGVVVAIYKALQPRHPALAKRGE